MNYKASENAQTVFVCFDEGQDCTYITYEVLFAIKGNAIKKYSLNDGQVMHARPLRPVAHILERERFESIIKCGEGKTVYKNETITMTDRRSERLCVRLRVLKPIKKTKATHGASGGDIERVFITAGPS